MSRKFKLIKEFPSSLKLGDIATDLGSADYYMINDNHLHTVRKCQDYPEFWEEIIEKDYEILSFKLKNSSYNNAIRYKNNFGMFPSTNGKDVTSRINEFSEESLLRDKDYDIYSVKRLSDGEIFTIGDKNGLTNGNGADNPILRFELSFNDSNGHLKKFRNRTTLKFVLGTGYNKTGEWGPFELEKLRPIKKPLFITEDGVEMFTGDTYLYIVTSNSSVSYKWKILEHVVDWDNPIKPPLGTVQFFSHAEAEHYILMNKPCLSINDVINASPNIYNKKVLQEIVKTRL